MTEIPNNVIRIPCTSETIFRYWIEFLSPFHHLTARETDVAAAFLEERYKLSKKIFDSELLDKILMGKDTRNKIRQACELGNQHFQVIETNLKRKKFFVNGKINPRLIPNIRENKGQFQLLLLFEYADV